MGLQTAPVLLFFPPTTGVHATADSAPIRYDFTNGYARKSLLSRSCLGTCAETHIGLSPRSKYTLGSVATFRRDRIPRSSDQLIGCV
jgi:hypothetical protein